MPPERPGPPATPYTKSIDFGRFSWATPLARDYCGAYAQVAEFYTGAPTSTESWLAALSARRASPIDGPAIADVVTAQLAARDAPPEAQRAAAALADANTVAIVTGQQAGLFGGPLFTLFKALTAITLARQVQTDHDVRAVPVFWVDAEDHDVGEVCTCGVLDQDLELRRITAELPLDTGAPVSSLHLPSSIATTIETLRDTLPSTEFTDELVDTLGTIYTDGSRVVDAFARWVDRVLGRHGLVVFDASDPGAKPLARDVFGRELQSRGELSRLATAAGAQLEKKGYHAQVTPSENAVGLFELDGIRRPVRQQGDGYAVGDARFTESELLGHIRTRPEGYSPNVLLRPIVQDTLFPTIAYVTGPNELAYLGQLREGYKRFGVPMPLLYPRLSATLLDRPATKFLHRHAVDFETLQSQDDRVLNRLISAQLPDDIETALGTADAQIDDTLAAIERAVPAVDPTLAGTARTTRDRMTRDLRTLRGKIVQAAKRRNDTLRRQFTRTRAQAFPGGEPQERAIGFIYFLNRYGQTLVDDLLDNHPPEIGQHWLVTL